MKQASSVPRQTLLTLCCIGALAAASPGRTQALPAGPIKIVNSFPPGGPSDIISRLVADKLESALQQTVVVENKPGAGGNIAADQVACAPADGQTILSGIDTTFTINPSIYKSFGWRLRSSVNRPASRCCMCRTKAIRQPCSRCCPAKWMAASRPRPA